ncbi:MAG: class I SAM-dependent methyltransferase [Rhizomicrobium sp.]
MVEVQERNRTALRVATLRAAHQLLDEPIVHADPIALRILGRVAESELRQDPFQYNDPISRDLRASVIIRSKVAEEELARAVARGVCQYVVLGAGLDTFAYRNPHGAQLHVFEVDHPSTQHWKIQKLEQADIPFPANLTMIPVDFENCSLLQGLQNAGFAEDRSACFSWLGVTMYLSKAAIIDVLEVVAKLPARSSITLDFRVPSSVLNPIERAIADVMGQHVAALGEPWLSAFEPARLREIAAGAGFTSVETFEPDELNCRYLSRRKDGLRCGSRMMCARV